MAIHGFKIKGSKNNIVNSDTNNAPAFLQVSEVSAEISTQVQSGVYPYMAWTQFNNETALVSFKNSDNYGSGWEIEGVAGENIGTGEVVYRSSNTRWKKAIADGTATEEGINMIGMCIQGGNNNDIIKILLQGFVSISSNNFNHQLASMDSYNGVPVYLDAVTYGYMTDVAPSGSGEIVRTLGYMYQNPYNSTAGASGSPVIYFNPDRTFIIV
jgi:hypothetical protein